MQDIAHLRYLSIVALINCQNGMERELQIKCNVFIYVRILLQRTHEQPPKSIMMHDHARHHQIVSPIPPIVAKVHEKFCSKRCNAFWGVQQFFRASPDFLAERNNKTKVEIQKIMQYLKEWLDYNVFIIVAQS